MVDTACAAIAPVQAKAPIPPTDINLFHCIYGHTHEALLEQTAKQQESSLSGDLHECRGCSMAKGLRKPIARLTNTRGGPFCSFRASAALALHCRKGESTAGEGVSGEGASSLDGGRVAELDSESDLDMTGAGPVLPARRKAPAAAATAITPKMTAPVGGATTAMLATPAMTATAQAAPSATGTCPRSQGHRRGACSISGSPLNSRANAQGPNHVAGRPERTPEVLITGLDFE